MSLVLIIGLFLVGLPLSLIIGFAAYIFLGFINDDKDARAVFNFALMVIAVGVLFIITHFVGFWIRNAAGG